MKSKKQYASTLPEENTSHPAPLTDTSHKEVGSTQKTCVKEITLPRGTVLKCEECGGEYVKPDSHARRFCSTSCSAVWRMRTHPQTWDAARRARTSEMKKAWYRAGGEKSKECIRRITDLCPMKDPRSVEKLKATLRRIGHKPSMRGGNGKPLTPPQQFLLSALGPPWVAEYSEGLKSTWTKGYPKHYKIDLAQPLKKIAIEVDGGSHNTALARMRDPKKDAKLTELGWKVLRFSNKEILSWRDSGTPMGASISTTLLLHGIHPTQSMGV